ncbi:hypothetical protein [Roseateles sp.]|uniref:hypothetical protein n=1 Tax=Roseateles sp. TaxID=1971397 RepID=UPI0035A10989
MPVWFLALMLALGGCTLGPDTYLVRKVTQVLVDGVAAPNASSLDKSETPAYTVGPLRARFLVSGQIQASAQVNLAGVLPVVERSPMRNSRLQPLRVSAELAPAAQQPFAQVEIDGRLIDRNGKFIAPSKVALGPFPCAPGVRVETATLTSTASALRVDRRICVQLEFDDDTDIFEALRLRFGTVRALAADNADASNATAARQIELLINPQEVVSIGH